MAEARVAVLLSGRGSNMQALVEQASGYRIVLVGSDRPDAAGLTWARARGIETFAMSPKGIGKAAFEDALDTALRAAGAEVVALAGYMRLLSPTFVARWRGRVVNIHPSLLPRYKGLDTHARAIAAGDGEAGCSVHLVTEELDGGRVLAQARVPILTGDTAEALAARVLVAEHRLYPQTLKDFVADMTADPPSVITRLRDLALAMPMAEEREADGAAEFAIEGGEAFAIYRVDGPEGAAIVTVRVDGPEDATSLVSRDPAIYSSADGRDGDWIAIRLDGADVDWALVGDRVAQSWELAAPRRLLEAGGR